MSIHSHVVCCDLRSPAAPDFDPLEVSAKGLLAGHIAGPQQESKRREPSDAEADILPPRPQDGAERIMRVTECVIGPEWRGLQVRLLDTFREEIVQLGEQHRVARSAEMTANVGTAGSPD
jgi:hypothetical protein